MRRHIVGEADIPERPLTEVMSVDPDFAVLVDSIEFYGDLAVLIRRRDAEAFPIPADAGRRVGAGAAAGLVLREWAFDAPVVRQVEAAPGCVGESGLLRARRIALEELPPKVE